jgi:hypothetical protein
MLSWYIVAVAGVRDHPSTLDLFVIGKTRTAIPRHRIHHSAVASHDENIGYFTGNRFSVGNRKKVLLAL